MVKISEPLILFPRTFNQTTHLPFVSNSWSSSLNFWVDASLVSHSCPNFLITSFKSAVSAIIFPVVSFTIDTVTVSTFSLLIDVSISVLPPPMFLYKFPLFQEHHFLLVFYKDAMYLILFLPNPKQPYQQYQSVYFSQTHAQYCFIFLPKIISSEVELILPRQIENHPI